MYDSAKSVLFHLLTKEDFKPVWDKWVEDCRPIASRPNWDGMHAMIMKYTNAAEVFKHNEIDTYFPMRYIEIANSETSKESFDLQLKLL